VSNWLDHDKLQIRKAGAQSRLADVVVANGFFSRLRGLLGQRELADGAGLLLVGTNDIHMWGMRFAIDAVFLKRVAGDWEVT
jgi:uncharacterized membrane protein (UPF0127 family)